MFESIIEFEWDSANKDKNIQKHDVSNFECEEIFFNKPLIVSEDKKHSEYEVRYFALGQTNSGRELFLVYTLRNNKVRTISARDQSRKERVVYGKNKEDTELQI